MAEMSNGRAMTWLAEREPDRPAVVFDGATTSRLELERLVVAESGLAAPADLARMQAVGAKAFLIGESLMRQADVTAATAALLAPHREQAAGHG